MQKSTGSLRKQIIIILKRSTEYAAHHSIHHAFSFAIAEKYVGAEKVTELKQGMMIAEWTGMSL